MARHFDLARSGRSAAHFDEAQLRHWQREAVGRADETELLAWLSGRLAPLAEPAHRSAFLQAVRGNLMFPRDVEPLVDVVCAEAVPLDDDALHDAVNVKRIATMCARDWGLWRTVTMNLKKVNEISAEYTWLPAQDRTIVVEKIERVLGSIDNEPKTTSWNIRSKIGDRVKWYKDVQEVAQ